MKFKELALLGTLAGWGCLPEKNAPTDDCTTVGVNGDVAADEADGLSDEDLLAEYGTTAISIQMALSGEETSITGEIQEGTEGENGDTVAFACASNQIGSCEMHVYNNCNNDFRWTVAFNEPIESAACTWFADAADLPPRDPTCTLTTDGRELTVDGN
ncbi:hypothetical protein IPG41_00630 [Candidatus Peregrinibacteria bacterium]|nr:MAG: hypothetical protein IPG41_00630 [Candidatus Peregrinibacteria bacterium]